jgi:hypothetical protein
MNATLEDIASLFPFCSIEMLKKLNDIAIISGGAVLFALKGIKTDDIDLFTHTDRMEEIKSIVSEYAEIEKIDNGVIRIKNCGTKIKVNVHSCMFKFDVERLFDLFDFDYYKCAFWMGKLHIAEECKEELDSMITRSVSTCHRRNRTTAKKGFLLCYLPACGGSCASACTACLKKKPCTGIRLTNISCEFATTCCDQIVFRMTHYEVERNLMKKKVNEGGVIPLMLQINSVIDGVAQCEKKLSSPFHSFKILVAKDATLNEKLFGREVLYLSRFSIDKEGKKTISLYSNNECYWFPEPTNTI